MKMFLHINKMHAAFWGILILFLSSCVPPNYYKKNNTYANNKSRNGSSYYKKYDNSTYEVYNFRRNSYRTARYRNTYPVNRKVGSKRASIIGIAKKYLGVPYRYGGTTPKGFDCSGYVMFVYRKSGIKISRSIKLQFYRGKRVYLKNALPGDLVFFKTSRYKRISHVGIYMGNNKFIHAPRTGRTVSYGSIRIRYWKKRFIGAVRYL